MLAGSCRDQLLNMRYIVDVQLSENEFGCAYRAQDAFDSGEVVIYAMPLSLKLSDKQVRNLQNSVKNLNSLVKSGFKGPKAFDVCGKVRYFVYDSADYTEHDGRNAIEKMQRHNEELLAEEIVEKHKLEFQLQQQISELEAVKKKLAENQDLYNRQIEQSAAQQRENEKITAELKGVIEIQKTRIQVIQSSLEQKICRVQAQLDDRSRDDSEKLNQAAEQIETLRTEKQQALKTSEEQCLAYELKLKQLKENAKQQKCQLEENLLLQSESNRQLLDQQHRFDTTIKELTEKLDVYRTEQDNLSQQLEQSTIERAHLLRQHQDLQAAGNEEIQSLKSRIESDKLQYEEKLRQTQSLTEQLDEELKQKLDEKSAIEVQFENTKNDYESEIAELKLKIEENRLQYDNGLNDANNTIESLKNRIDAAEQSRRQQLQKAQDEIAELNDKLENEKKIHINGVKELQYQAETEALNERISEADSQYREKLNHAQWKIDALQKTIGDAEEQYEKLLTANNARHRETINKLKAEAEEQKTIYAEQLEKTKYKIRALSTELDKLTKKQGNNAQTPGRMFAGLKVPAAVSASALAAGLIIGIGLSNIFDNIRSKEVSLEHQQVIALALPQKKHTENHETAEKQKQVSVESDDDSFFEKEIERLDKFYSSKLTQETARVYLKAAQKGDAEAMFKLGMAYLEGNGTNKSPQKAVTWLSKAANSDYPDALLELGNLYYFGEIIDGDTNKAMQYYSKAAEAGNAMAMYNIGRLYEEQAGTKSVTWYQKAADRGLPKAMNQLAQMYYSGTFVTQDMAKTFEYYELSAQHNDTKAMYNLASLYQNGVGVEKDVRKAMLWLIRAAREGDADSMYQLGTLFENGTYIEQDIEKALYWYQTASESGHKKAPEKLIELKKTS